jgi:hypothetical protein
MSKEDRKKLLEEADAMVRSHQESLSASVSAMVEVKVDIEATLVALEKDLDELEKQVR